MRSRAVPPLSSRIGRGHRQRGTWIAASIAIAIATAVVAGAAVAAALLPMTTVDLVELTLLLTISGGGSTVIGLAILSWMDHRGARLVSRAFVAGAMGAVAALASMLAVAGFMFVNTGHDLRLLLAVSVTSGGVAALISATGAWQTTTRVQRLSTEIAQLAAGDYDESAGPAQARATNDEITHLAGAVEDLRVRLRTAEFGRQAAERERHELSAAISHDLRTPLAALRAAIDALTEGVVTDPGDVEAYHRRMRREVDRLSRLVDDLLELARLEAGQLGSTDREAWRALSLAEIAAEVVDSMEPLAARSELRLRLHAEAALPAIPLDGARVERAVGNLVRNAIQHATPGTEITVAIHREPDAALPDTAQPGGTDAAGGDAVSLSVHNRGEAIPPAALPRIWERFYRAEPSRTRGGRGDADGAGLGLAIVRAIVEWHGGSVAAHSGDGVTTLSLRLPVPPAVEPQAPA